MNFGDQIKAVRKENHLTQEEFSQKLNISRQAVSNWENNRNLPDIEMLIAIASVFHVSLDQLILGGSEMTNNMVKKLINDGSETKRARFNMVSICIGACLLLIGFICLFIKAVSIDYVDSAGFLHENFFLLPVGFLFLFGGFVVFFVTGIRSIVTLLRHEEEMRGWNRAAMIISFCIVTLCIVAFFLLYATNSGMIG